MHYLVTCRSRKAMFEWLKLGEDIRTNTNFPSIKRILDYVLKSCHIS